MTFSELDDTNLLPENEEQIYPWVEFERITNNYRRYYNFSYIGRESDVAVGTDFRVRFGTGHFGNDERLYRLRASYSTAVSYSDKYFFQMNSSADLLREDATDSLRNSIVSVEGRYHYFINGKNRWYVKTGFSRGYNLAQFRQLTIGEVEGVRGYPLAYQRGDKRYVLNVERRFYSDIHWLNIVRLGAVVFFDMGRAWGVDEFPSDNVLKSVGFGLRLHSSKVGNPSVVHMNVGFPILNDNDDLNDALFSISVEGQF
jgi:outer membrane protein assembly factor BamA